MRRSASKRDKWVGLSIFGLAAVAVAGLAFSTGSGTDERSLTQSGPAGSANVTSEGEESGGGVDRAAEPRGPLLGAATAPSEDGDSATAGTGLPGISSQTAGIDRKIIQTASLSLQVDRVSESFEEVGRIAASLGGFISSSSFSLQGEDEIASLTVRVPAERSQDAIARFRGLGVKVLNQSSEANDVTEQFTDLSATLRNLEATEDQLLLLLGRAEEIGEILQVQDRLNSVRGSIEQVQGRIQLLEGLSELATITVHLSPVLPVAGSNGGGTDISAEVSKAWDSSIEFLTDVAAGVVRVVVFAWWMPIAAAPVILLASRLRGRPQSLEAAD